ncbi:filamentous hemagglutinin N-terminal domain-containing protein [Halomicronema sp. CCY15110]|uniref:two-partner secretion domain-containing protein n=1 Tax=Halomicronema sp. CCY15110 TaxID=2767773 RepID=UPI00194FDAB7|nr:filamentous hemagglutinin N-terminal domain-containing protein [Halomicronema sp. CCY15110]
MNIALNSSVTALVFGSALLGSALPGVATPITPDPTGATQVEAAGDRFNITGGNLSADQQTLFQAFTEFGLTAQQTAAFLAQPNVRSILGAITGGQASYIDGRLQVAGSAANLYLVNPAGILFGPNAQLDLAGSFAATTASGVLFDEALFNVLGPNDYSQLTGAPTGFAFTGEGGAIVNAADLAVLPGESITLVGGQVISTGTLTAPGGDITIAAIPDSNLVRISQTDMALSLELEALPVGTPSSLLFEPLALPELLTGSEIATATGITTNPDGTIALVNTAVADVTGMAIASGTLDTSGPTGGDVTVVGDRVHVLSATVNASGDQGGGTVRIGGDLMGQLTLPGSSLTTMDAESAIAANALVDGDGGTVILWSDDTTAFAGDISAQGGPLGGDGGFVEVSGARSLIFDGTVNTTAPLGTDGELLIDPTDIIIRNGTADGDDSDLLATLLSEPTIPFTAALPTILYESELEGLSGDTAVTLQASNSITIEDLADNELTFAERSPILVNGVPITESLIPSEVPPDPAPIRFESGGTFAMNQGDTISAPGRDVFITAGGAVTLGDIRTWRDGNDNANIAPSVETDGNLTVIGATIQAGDLNALQRQIIDADGVPLISGAVGLGGGNGSRVYLESTAGDITVDSILSGAGGLVVNAADTFRVEDFFRVEAVSQRDADGNAIASDTYDLSIFVAIPLPRDAADNPIPPAADQQYFFRGVKIAPSTRGEIEIAFDTLNTRRFEERDFFVGPAIAGDGGVAPPPGENGTLAGLLFAEPDRTIVTFLESQLFEPTSEVADTTGLDDLADEDDNEVTLRGQIETEEPILEICNDDNEDPDAECEE